jgi:hypothetical protein
MNTFNTLKSLFSLASRLLRSARAIRHLANSPGVDALVNGMEEDYASTIKQITLEESNTEVKHDTGSA